MDRGRIGRLELLESRCLLAADVYISELLASNDRGIVDEDGDDSDWAEIFNAGPDDINLDGWYLTDDDSELDKWAFPNQILSAGNALLVFASDKDRSTAGEELHTNFKLSASGEYLGLAREVAGGQLETVSEFHPAYPRQIADVSYGITQDVSIRRILSSDADARLLIPDQQPSSDWTSLGFDDSGWQATQAAIGYQNTVPGFTIEDAKSSGRIVNLSEADALLNGEGQANLTTSISAVVNFLDAEGGGGSGRFGNDLAFPGDSASDDNDFAVRATGTIMVPSTGTWTFGTNSDDGVRLKIDGELIIDDDTLHPPQDRIRQVQLTRGPHQIELVYFERGGGAEVELFAARGSRTTFSSAFDLVGDVENGGLAVKTSPSGGTTVFSNLVRSDVRESMFEQASSVYLRVPFEVQDPTVFESLSLKVHYDDGFVAYLNGQEVARRNAANDAKYDATAASDRPQSSALTAEFISITDHLDVLRPGQNLLAMHGLNARADSDEFLLAAELQEVNTTAGDAVYFRVPTPGTFNPSVGAEEFLLDDITLSRPHGFQDEAFQLTISSATQGTNIRFTLDGSLPTESNGIDYSVPLTIDKTTTIRARSFKPGAEPSRTETATYLFIDDILKQAGTAPDGWPTSRTINGQSLDYGMDPDIVDNGRWGPLLAESLTSIPSMSVVMSVDDFIGARNGIYTHAGSHGRAWERPASLELINPNDATDGFQVEMGIRIRGGFSRSGSNPKHAFRLFFRDEYGDSKLEYPLFGEEGVDEFDKVDLRTTQNYSWSFQGSDRNTFLRDVFSRDVQGLMGQPYTRSRFYHLYINGQYWGLYQTQERSEARYAASYFGGDSEDYDVVKSAGSSGGYENEATDGNLDAYRRLADLFYQSNGLGDANSEDYWRAQGMNPDGTRNPDYERLLDVDNLIGYMIITYFTSDADGPGSKFTRPRVNNYFGIFNRADPDGFKFFEHDSEHSLDTGNAAGANYDMVAPLTTGGSQFRYFNPHWMHEQLAKTNTVYRERFADQVYQHFFHEGVLSPENAKSLIDGRAAQIESAIVAESARWGDAKRSTPYTQSTWRNAVNRLKNWFDGRAETVLQQLRRQNWYPDADPPQFLVHGQPQHGGQITSLDPISFKTSAALSYQTVFAKGSVWKYLDDGSNQQTAWREPDFDDATWKSGRAEIGYGESSQRTTISFGSDSENKHRTAYFRSTFQVDDPAAFDEGLIRLLRDDGAIVYVNGQEVVRSNMPAGSISYRTFASSVVGGAEEDTFFEFAFPVALLRKGENTIAVEVHQANSGSSDVNLDMEVQLGKFFLSDATILYTLDGSDPKLPNGDAHPNAISFAGGEFRLPTDAEINVRVRGNDGIWSVLNSASFAVSNVGVVGDLDADGTVDAADIDALTAAIRNGNAPAEFDLDANGLVDAADLTTLVEGILGTRAGDVDLDGRVTFSDFLVLAENFGNPSAGWSVGNVNLDTEVSFADFLLLAENFGFANGPPPAPVDAALGEVDDWAVVAVIQLDSTDEDADWDGAWESS